MPSPSIARKSASISFSATATDAEHEPLLLPVLLSALLSALGFLIVADLTGVIHLSADEEPITVFDESNVPSVPVDSDRWREAYDRQWARLEARQFELMDQLEEVERLIEKGRRDLQDTVDRLNVLQGGH